MAGFVLAIHAILRLPANRRRDGPDTAQGSAESDSSGQNPESTCHGGGFKQTSI